MSGQASAVQKAVVAAGLADAGVKAIVGAKAPAIYAVGQPFPAVFPRTLIETPQIVPSRGIQLAEVFVTLHHFATGADCSLVAGDLADAWANLLTVAPLTIAGQVFGVLTPEGSHPVGDPDPSVAHVVSTFRLVVGPTA